MVKLNRTSEYGLLALHYMERKSGREPGALTSAREIVEFFKLPFEITAKTLQRLKEVGFIQSAHGARGGYAIQKPLSEISLAEFLQKMEGDQAIVSCCSENSTDATASTSGCEFREKCEIHPFLTDVNSRVLGFLSGIRLGEIKVNYENRNEYVDFKSESQHQSA